MIQDILFDWQSKGGGFEMEMYYPQVSSTPAVMNGIII